MRPQKSHQLHSNSTVLIYHDICLKENDIETVRGNHWINDQIIAFYFQYLESHVYREFSNEFLFVSPQVTQLLKMNDEPNDEAKTLLEPLNPHSRKFLFFPVNDNNHERAGGTHWNLLVYSRPDNTFYTYDSNGNHNNYATSKVFDVLRKTLNCPNAHFILSPSAQQKNSYDCGIYVLCNVENIVNHIKRGKPMRNVSELSYECIAEKRNDILRIIQTLGGKI